MIKKTPSIGWQASRDIRKKQVVAREKYIAALEQAIADPALDHALRIRYLDMYATMLHITPYGQSRWKNNKKPPNNAPSPTSILPVAPVETPDNIADTIYNNLHSKPVEELINTT